MTTTSNKMKTRYQNTALLVCLPLLLFVSLLLVNVINNNNKDNGNNSIRGGSSNEDSSSSDSSSTSPVPNVTITEDPALAPSSPEEEAPTRREGMKMETKEIAPGVEMPVMSIGTGGMERQDAYKIVTNWLELGGTGIDTALNYNNQDLIAQAIADASNVVTRKELFITTKIPSCDEPDLVIQDIETNLALLNTTYVDLLLIHSPRGGTPELCAETWSVLEYYYQQNKTRAIGVSNFRTKHLVPLLADATITPHVNQMKLNVLSKDVDTIEFCNVHDITVEAYSPLGRGGGGKDDVVHHLVVEELAEKHNVTTYQIALKWIVQHGWVLTFQSSSQKHQAIDANVFDEGFSLTLEEMKRLDQIGIPL